MRVFLSIRTRIVLACTVGAFLPDCARATLLVGIGQNFIGSTFGQDSSLLPPDPNGAVGPNHFVELINGRFTVYNKTNGVRVRTMTGLSFLSNAGVNVPNNWLVTDPRLIYDPSAQRWLALQVDYDPSGAVTTNRFLLAISATSDPTGSWKGVALPGDINGLDFADFPTLGLDAQNVYLSADLFDSSQNPIGPTLVSLPKADLLAGTPSIAHRTSFGTLTYSARGEILQPVVAVDGSSRGSVLAIAGLTGTVPQTTLKVSSIFNTVSPGPALLSPATTIPVDSYSVPINPPQPDGTSNLDDGDARFSSFVYRVNGVLFAVHGTQMNTRAALRWYRIDATNYVVLESGTITDPNLDLFYPSIAANTNNVIVIGCNGSSSNTFVSAYAVAGETVNGVTTFGKLLLLKPGVTSFQNPDRTGTSRWGDYSTTCVDPANPDHFWTIQMYPSGPDAWSTQVTELLTSRFKLTITRTNANVLICWPSLAKGFQLQTTSTLSPSSSWSAVAQARFTNGTQTCVLLPAFSAERFFRLRAAP